MFAGVFASRDVEWSMGIALGPNPELELPLLALFAFLAWKAGLGDHGVETTAAGSRKNHQDSHAVFS